MFRDHVPALMHGNDGLIFTSAESPYTPGTDPKMYVLSLLSLSVFSVYFPRLSTDSLRFNSLKWKPPAENSIDFLLQLKFPPKRDDEHEPDYTAKPAFMLLMNHGHEGNHFWDIMEVDDETWETYVHSLSLSFILSPSVCE